MESIVHQHLKTLSLYWLKEKMTDLCANEVKLYVRRKKLIADAVGINLKRKEARMIEVKASRADFLRDKMIHSEFGYHSIVDYAYIMTPEGLLKNEEIPKGYGLLEVDPYDNITVRKNPVRNPKKALTIETLIKRTGRAATNTVLFQQLSKETKDVTKGAFAKNAKVHYIRATCPRCKNRQAYLIKVDQSEVTCLIPSCKETIPLDRSRVHIITSYNDDFFTQLCLLMDESQNE